MVVGSQPFQLSLSRVSRTETPRDQNSGQALVLQWLRTMHHRGRTWAVTLSLDTPPGPDTELPHLHLLALPPGGSCQIPGGDQEGKEALHSSMRPEHRRQPRYRPGVAGGHGRKGRAPEGSRNILPGCGQEMRPQGPATSSKQRREKKRGEGKQTVGTSPSSSTQVQVGRHYQAAQGAGCRWESLSTRRGVAGLGR